MPAKSKKVFDPKFPFSDDIFLSDDPMTDDEFKEFVRLENDEIPIEDINYSLPCK